MFAVDHAATALLLKRRYPSAPLAPLLLSVQAMELAWVVLNYLGVERTTTAPVVRSVADIHLAYMPYSHSIGTAVGAALLVWAALEFGLGRRQLGRAVGLGIVSHLVLDLLTHAHDIVQWPGLVSPRLGLGLYDSAPLIAFVVELLYGIACWWIYRGGRGLLVLVTVGNLANLSMLSADVPGVEQFLAHRPLAVVTLVAAQIVVTLLLTGLLARVGRGAQAAAWRYARRPPGCAGHLHDARLGTSQQDRLASRALHPGRGTGCRERRTRGSARAEGLLRRSGAGV